LTPIPVHHHAMITIFHHFSVFFYSLADKKIGRARGLTVLRFHQDVIFQYLICAVKDAALRVIWPALYLDMEYLLFYWITTTR
jgi:hypothetical protein